MSKSRFNSWHEKQISVLFKSSETATEPTQPTNRRTPGLFFAGEKRPGREADHSLQLSAFIAKKKRILH
jgi:hypothetical protein